MDRTDLTSHLVAPRTWRTRQLGPTEGVKLALLVVGCILVPPILTGLLGPGDTNASPATTAGSAAISPAPAVENPGIGSTLAVWRASDGVMPNGKPAGHWTLPDGFSFKGAGDLTQQKVQAIAEALRQSDQEHFAQPSSQPAQDALDKYIVGRLAQGVSNSEARALVRLINRDTVYPSAGELPGYRSTDYPRSAYVTPGTIPEDSSIVSIRRAGQHESASIAVVGPARSGARPRDTFSRRFDEYNSPAGSVGMVNTRSGEHYAPAGQNGYVGSRDGTYYSRSGPNGVIDTRTGRYIPAN